MLKAQAKAQAGSQRFNKMKNNKKQILFGMFFALLTAFFCFPCLAATTEIETLRTENSETFFKSDQKYVKRVYFAPKYHKDAKNAFIQIPPIEKSFILPEEKKASSTFVGLMKKIFFPYALAATTTAPNSKDAHIRSDTPTTNAGSSELASLGYRNTTGRKDHVILNSTLPIVAGEIEEVKYCAYFEDNYLGSGESVDIHELATSEWVELETTWNIYSTGNNWPVAGGDYSATVIDTAVIALESYNCWTLLGDGATDPLTITWGDNLNLLLKKTSESGFQFVSMYTRENANTDRLPYFEIIYTPESTESTATNTTNIFEVKKWTKNGTTFYSIPAFLLFFILLLLGLLLYAFKKKK